MAALASLPTELLWRYALAAIPLTILVAVVARWLPCRPATRHTLWFMVLLWLVAAPLMPQAPPLEVSPVLQRATGLLAAYAESQRDGHPAEAAPRLGNEQPVEQTSSEGGSSTIHWTAQEWSAARLRHRDGPRSPLTLAQANGVSGPPTVHLQRSRIWSPPSTVETRKLPRPEASTPSRLTRRSPESTTVPRDRPARTQRATRHHRMNSDDAFIPGHSQGVDTAVASAEPSPAVPPWKRVGGSDFGPDPRVTAKPEPSRTTETAGGDAAPIVISASKAFWTTAAREWFAALVAVRDSIARIPPIPASVWVMGALLIVLSGCIRAMRFQSLLESAVPAPGSVRRLVAREAARMSLRCVPETFFVKLRVSPMIWCGRRIRLILPVSLWTQLDDTGRRAVVIHELAHVRRRDHWVSRVELCVGAIYWWYPLVWWVRSRLHAEAEKCCDAWVTTLLPQDRRAYAEALLRTKQYVRENNHGLPILGICMTNGRAKRFARRLKMVMTKSVRPGLSLPGTLLVGIIATAAWLATPVHSCPSESKAKKTVAVAPCATVAPCADVKPSGIVEARVVVAPCDDVAPVFAVLPGCGSCGDGKLCTGCKNAAKACKRCAKGKACKVCRKALRGDCCNKKKFGKCRDSCCLHTGIGSVGYRCEDCKSGSRCSACAKAFGYSSKAMNTYQKYMAGKDFGKAYSDSIHSIRAYEIAKLLPVVPTMSVVGYGPTDVDDRMDRLEDRLDRLGDQLERIADKLSSGDGSGKKKSRRTRESRGVWVPREPREPRPPREPRAPRAPRPPAAFSSPVPTPDAFFGVGAKGGETIIRAYELPGGKLEAMVKLMSRDDIPVLIRPMEGAIEVHGTNRQHKIFKAFLSIIHPKGGWKDAESDAGIWRDAQGQLAMARDRALVDRQALQAERQLIQAQQQAFQAELMQKRGAASAFARAQLEQRLQERHRVIERVQVERRVIEAQRRRIEGEGNSMRERAEQMLEAAQELREQADQLRDEADDLRGEAEVTDPKNERSALLVRLESLLVDANGLESQATAHEKESSQVEREVDRFDNEVQRLEEQMEGMDAQLEELEQKLIEEQEEKESEG